MARPNKSSCAKADEQANIGTSKSDKIIRIMTKDISEGVGQSNSYLDCIRVGKGCISQQKTDAIVMITSQNLEHKGDITQEILEAGGPELDTHILENVLQPMPGDVFAVPGFDLPCAHVLIGIAPVWRTEFDRQDKTMIGISYKALALAHELGLNSVAFPILKGGKFGFPKSRAARLIVQGIRECLDAHGDEMRVKEIRLVGDEKADVELFKERLKIERG